MDKENRKAVSTACQPGYLLPTSGRYYQQMGIKYPGTVPSSRRQSVTQACVTPVGFVVANTDGHGFAASHDDHHFFAAGDGGVNQVALKQDIVLGDDGNDDHRIFRSLGFMN